MPSQQQPEFLVEVTPEDGGYVAECAEIGLVTEADSYEELIERACAVAPEVAEMNGFSGGFSLVFWSRVQTRAA
jgi:enoyl-CoA hydratase/carnithine racemase